MNYTLEIYNRYITKHSKSSVFSENSERFMAVGCWSFVNVYFYRKLSIQDRWAFIQAKVAEIFSGNMCDLHREQPHAVDAAQPGDRRAADFRMAVGMRVVGQLVYDVAVVEEYLVVVSVIGVPRHHVA